MFPNTDPLDAHIQAVHATGIDPPAEWSALLARYTAYPRLDRPMAARLADAVIGGAEDIDSLHAAALAEVSAMPPAHAELDHTVRTAVMTRLRELYAPHAAPNYQQVGADFDSLAHKFTAAAGLVDPETPAVDMVSASEKTRKAWGDACPRHAPIDSERSQPV